MSARPQEPRIEATPEAASAPANPAEVEARLRQQVILSEFGVEALRGKDFDLLLQRATELCAQGMGASIARRWNTSGGRTRSSCGRASAGSPT